jgi:hypothetical protein
MENIVREREWSRRELKGEIRKGGRMSEDILLA